MFRVYSNSWKEVAALCVLAAEVVFCCGAGFTKVNPGDSAVAKVLFDEVRLALAERYYAVYGTYYSSYGPSDTGDVAYSHLSSAALYDGLQQALLNRVNYNKYVDLTALGATNTNGVVVWTEDTWGEYTGMTNAGRFRRLTNAAELGTGTTNWLYGKMQAGDIVGHWLWEDLQAGLSALKWTRELNDDLADDYTRGGYGSYYPLDSQWGIAFTNAYNLYATGAWQSAGSLYSCKSGWGSAISGAKRYYSERKYASPVIENVWTGVPCEAEFYVRCDLYEMDLDGIGLPTDAASDWAIYWETLPLTNTASRTGSTWNVSDDNPMDLVGRATPWWWGPGNYRTYRATVDPKRWVLKWQFSNSD